MLDKASDRRPIISPSILSADFGNIKAEFQRILQAGADWIHLDVMDGHNVPNLTFGPPVISKWRKYSDLPFDAHLMMENPEIYLDSFLAAGVDAITIPVEIFANHEAIFGKIHSAGKKSGIAFNPETPVEDVLPFLEFLDIVLVMAVKPGFGGQSFNPVVLEKITRLAQIRAEHPQRYRYLISVDGGINNRTAEQVKTAGADILVSGTYIFQQVDYTAAIKSLL